MIRILLVAAAVACSFLGASEAFAGWGHCHSHCYYKPICHVHCYPCPPCPTPIKYYDCVVNETGATIKLVLTHRYETVTFPCLKPGYKVNFCVPKESVRVNYVAYDVHGGTDPIASDYFYTLPQDYCCPSPIYIVPNPTPVKAAAEMRR